MAANEKGDGSRGFTRRGFLGIFSLGVASLAGAGFLLRDSISPGGRANDPELPGEDSIFHPRKDPRSPSQERSANS